MVTFAGICCLFWSFLKISDFRFAHIFEWLEQILQCIFDECGAEIGEFLVLALAARVSSAFS